MQSTIVVVEKLTTRRWAAEMSVMLLGDSLASALPDEYSDQNLKMKRRDFCLEFFCQFFSSGLPSTKLQAKVVLLFLILKLL